ncbi:MAG: hypothetical protein ACK4FL_03390 [Microgenomates group bacterium]
MSRKNEIKNSDLIENKPYLTKKELSIILDKKGKNLDKKISLLLRDQVILSLKKGLYISKIFYLKNKENIEEYLANIIYYPSYLSKEYVLAKEGVIPESVFSYTSVTIKATRFFKNQLGDFSYNKIKENLFTGYYLKNYIENYKIKIATKAKALFDYFYFIPFQSAKQIDDLRLNWDNLEAKDIKEFESFVDLSKSLKMEKIYQLLKKRYDNR